MSISFNCPSCMKALKVRDEYAGRSSKCPRCGQSVFVPGSPPVAALAQFQAPVAKPFVPQPVLVSLSPPPLPSSDLWHYTMNGVQQPPTSEQALRQMLAVGQLHPSEMAWKPGMASWVPASGLFAEESPPPLPSTPQSIAAKSMWNSPAVGCSAAIAIVIGGFLIALAVGSRGNTAVAVYMLLPFLVVGVLVGAYYAAVYDKNEKAKRKAQKLASQRLTKAEQGDETSEKKKSHSGEAAGGVGGVLVLIFLAWLFLKDGGLSSKPGGSVIPHIPGISEPTMMPPLEIDPSVNTFLVFSDWKREGSTITCRIKAKIRIDPGIGNLSPSAEFYDKDGVRIDEESFFIPSTMTEGEVIEKSIYVFGDKLQRTTRIKIKIKRTVF